jgi:hypothetical protein
MAYQAGPLRLKGKLGDLSFYHHKQYGYLVRLKGGPTKHMIATSPQFERTRENASEFALAAAAGKLIRQAVLMATGLKGDSNVTQRLTGLLVTLGKTDFANTRGSRNPVAVFDEPDSRLLLCSFPFYTSKPISATYCGKITCHTSTGSIIFPELLSSEFFRTPKGATHVQIKAAIAVLDFDNRSYTICQAPVYTARLENTMPQADFVCDLQSVGSGYRIGILSITFLQEKNEELYLLTDGMSLGVVG